MKRILIVDDDPDLVDALILPFEKKGYEVSVAFNGDEGLIKARQEHPDLIILDIMLPALNGYYVCKSLKDDEKYQHIPIVFLTNRDHTLDTEIAEDVKAEAYFTKPFEEEELISAVEKLLKRKN